MIGRTNAGAGGGGGIAIDGGIVVEYPETLGLTTSYYSGVTPDKKKVFLSGTEKGLWVFDVNTGKSEKIIEQLSTYNRFSYSPNGDMYIGSLDDSMVYRYNSSNSTIEQFEGGKNSIFFWLSNEEALISSATSSHLLLYSNIDNSTTELLSTGANVSNAGLLPNGNVIFSGGGSSSQGVFIYDAASKSATQIYEYGYNWACNVLQNGDALIASTTSTFKEILLYKYSTNTITPIFTANYHYFIYVTELSNGNALIGSGYNFGLLKYNATDNTISQIYTTGAYKQLAALSNGRALIPSLSSSDKGIYVYDSNDDSKTKIYTIGYNWINVHKLINNNYLISSSNSGGAGILLYNTTNDSIIKIHSTGYGYRYFKNLSNGNVLLSSEFTGESSGIFLYKMSDNSVTRLFEYGASWSRYVNISGDDYYITSLETSYRVYTLKYTNEDENIQVMQRLNINGV